MNPEELEEFSTLPFAKEAFRLRRYNDQSKSPSANPPDLLLTILPSRVYL